MMFAYAKPWSVADGVRNWGDATFNSLNLSEITIIPPYLYSTSIINIGIVAGAMAAALMAGQFRVQSTSSYELFKGLIGGALMGIGAAMAFGCNIGGFFSAISALSMAGVAMMAGLMIGAYIGLRILILETKYVNFPASKRASTAVKRDSPSRQRNHSIIGVILLIAGLGVALLYDGFDYPTRGGFLLFGLILGLVMQRTRFCFVRAFREPFMTGDGEMTKAVGGERNRFLYSEMDRPARSGRPCIARFLVWQLSWRHRLRDRHVGSWWLCSWIPVAGGRGTN